MLTGGTVQTLSTRPCAPLLRKVLDIQCYFSPQTQSVSLLRPDSTIKSHHERTNGIYELLEWWLFYPWYKSYKTLASPISASFSGKRELQPAYYGP